MGRRLQVRISDDERDLIRFVDERQTNPLRRGDLTRDIKFAIRFLLKMKEGASLDRCADLTETPMDHMTDEENYWYINHHDKGSEKIKRNLNARPRYNKYMKASSKHRDGCR